MSYLDGGDSTRSCRAELAKRIEAQLGPFDPRHLQALIDVPRERFVRAGDLDRANDDIPLPLDDQGLATISAPHAYLLSFRLLALAEGDALLELGSGSGYGAALAARIVGRTGRVLTIEIDVELARLAKELLLGFPNVEVQQRDAVRSAGLFAGMNRIVCTFAVAALPPVWLDALGTAAVLVAPVGEHGQDQRLMRVARERGALQTTEHGRVRYVQNRSE
jgi:protein-L-isoaspartate(D-aspartate) O-methyltransferase